MSSVIYLIIFIALMLIAVGGIFFAVVRPWAPWYHRKSVSEKKPFQPDLGMKTPDIARPEEDDPETVKPPSAAAAPAEEDEPDDGGLYESFSDDGEDDE